MFSLWGVQRVLDDDLPAAHGARLSLFPGRGGAICASGAVAFWRRRPGAKLANRGWTRVATAGAMIALAISFLINARPNRNLNARLLPAGRGGDRARQRHDGEPHPRSKVDLRNRSRISEPFNGLYMAFFFLAGATGSGLGAGAYAAGGWRWVSCLEVGLPLAGLACALAEPHPLHGGGEGGPRAQKTQHPLNRPDLSRLAGANGEARRSRSDFAASDLHARLRKYRVQKKYQSCRPSLVVHGNRPDTLSSQNRSRTSSRTIRRQVECIPSVAWNTHRRSIFIPRPPTTIRMRKSTGA